VNRVRHNGDTVCKPTTDKFNDGENKVQPERTQSGWSLYLVPQYVRRGGDRDDGLCAGWKRLCCGYGDA